MSTIDPLTGATVPIDWGLSSAESAKLKAALQSALEAITTVSTSSSETIDLSSIQIPRGRSLGIGDLLKIIGEIQLIVQEFTRRLQNQDLALRVQLGGLSGDQLAYIATLKNLMAQALGPTISAISDSESSSTLFLGIGFLLLTQILEMQRQKETSPENTQKRMLGAYSDFIKKLLPNRPEFANAIDKTTASAGLAQLDPNQKASDILAHLAKLVFSQVFANAIKRHIEMSIVAGYSQASPETQAVIKKLFEGTSRASLTPEETNLLKQVIEKNTNADVTDNLINYFISLSTNNTALENIALETVAINKEKLSSLSDEEIAKILDFLKQVEKFFFLLLASLLGVMGGGIATTELLSGNMVDELASQITKMGLSLETAKNIATQLTPTFAQSFLGLQTAGLSTEQTLAALLTLAGASLGITMPSTFIELLQNAQIIPEKANITPQDLYQGIQQFIQASSLDEPTKKATLDVLAQLYQPKQIETLVNLLENVGLSLETANKIAATVAPYFDASLLALKASGLTTEQAQAALLSITGASLGITPPSPFITLLQSGQIIPEKANITPQDLYQGIQQFIQASSLDEPTKKATLDVLAQLYQPKQIETLVNLLENVGLSLETANKIAATVAPYFDASLLALKASGLTTEQAQAALLSITGASLGITPPSPFITLLQSGQIIPKKVDITPQDIYQGMQQFIQTSSLDENTKKTTSDALSQLYQPQKTTSTTPPQEDLELNFDQNRDLFTQLAMQILGPTLTQAFTTSTPQAPASPSVMTAAPMPPPAPAPAPQPAVSTAQAAPGSSAAAPVVTPAPIPTPTPTIFLATETIPPPAVAPILSTTIFPPPPPAPLLTITPTASSQSTPTPTAEQIPIINTNNTDAFITTINGLAKTPPALPQDVLAQSLFETYSALPRTTRKNLESALPQELLSKYSNVPKPIIAAIQNAPLPEADKISLLDYMTATALQNLSHVLEQQNKIIHRLFAKSPEEIRVAEENKTRNIQRDQLTHEEIIRKLHQTRPLLEQTRKTLRTELKNASPDIKKGIEKSLFAMTDKRIYPFIVEAQRIMLYPSKIPSLTWSAFAPHYGQEKRTTMLEG